MTVTRRGFIGGAVGAAITASTADAGTVKHFEGYPGRYGLLHDTTLCVGCRSCEVACKQVNNLPPVEQPVNDPRVFDTVRRTTDTSLTVVNRYVDHDDGEPDVYRKLQCMHCNEPCCATVCPCHAFEKTPEGPVLYHPELCMGCRYCVMACPYYALAYEYENPLTPKVMRCTMCYDRIKEGLHPGCADACPMGAITFGERDELIRIAHERIRKHPDRYIDHIFGEHEFGGTSWMVLAGTPFRDLDLDEGVTSEPLPAIATSYLGVVPLVITIYPGLLLGMYAFSKRHEAVAKSERQEAVAVAVAAAEADAQTKLAAAAERAKKDKERAVDAAVKKALAEAKEGGDA
ncbi:MAG: 4Fe-4S dicluster domain-containing protein [Holophagae bacterium]|jgi:Fe-S-cluster-containing dehydrogenase component